MTARAGRGPRPGQALRRSRRGRRGRPHRDPGDVFGYLGPNGAGKTTSLRMMLGLIRPTEGSVRLFGRDPQAGVAALEGVAGFVEAPRFYPYLSGRRTSSCCAALDGDGAAGRDRGGPRHRRAAATAAKDRVGGYSHGMRQRLGIAAALLRAPRLHAARRARDRPRSRRACATCAQLVRRLADEGMTVVLSSHLLAEVEELCNRVAIVRTRPRRLRGHARRAAPRGGHRLPPAHDRRRRARSPSAPRSPASRRPRGPNSAASRSAPPPSARSASCRWRWPRRARSSSARARSRDARGPLLRADRGRRPRRRGAAPAVAGRAA